MELKSFCLLCDLYPQKLEFLLGKTLKRNGVIKGTITKIFNKSIIVDDGKFTILKDWLKEERGYQIEDLDGTGEILEFVNKKYNELIDEEREKEKLIDKLENEKIGLEDKKAKYEDVYNTLNSKLLDILKRKFIDVDVKEYKNHCWNSSICSGRVDSEKSEFCIICGWFKCCTCKRCGCGKMNRYWYNSQQSIYKRFLKNNPQIDKMRDNVMSHKWMVKDAEQELIDKKKESVILSLELYEIKQELSSISSLADGK